MGAVSAQPTLEPKPALEELHLHRLLVAVDGSANAQLALSAAVTAARRDHAAVTLISVAPDVVAAAREADYDAILMGARGLGRVAALMGAVSQYVLHHADTAVFVAHAPREADA
jgi:nucleotide-binding universal stress UspA family protein